MIMYATIFCREERTVSDQSNDPASLLRNLAPEKTYDMILDIEITFMKGATAISRNYGHGSTRNSIPADEVRLNLGYYLGTDPSGRTIPGT
jgi:hypothetical protein